MKAKLFKQLLVVTLLLIANCAIGAPAFKVKRVITLADGTRKTVVLSGDENLHFYLDEDNNAYTEDDNGNFIKANKRDISLLWQKRLTARNQHRIDRAKKIGMIPQSSNLSARSMVMHRAKWGAESNPISGAKKGLVILVNFKDVAMNDSHGNKFYDGYFNKAGFSEQGGKGSVHDYFLESSYGKFDLTFDVIGPVTVSKNMSYYGQNMQGADMYPATMVSEACKLADNLGVDFSKYDWDNDGMVDQVYIVYAGYGENMGGAANTIWPHESNLTLSQMYNDGNGPIKFDGVSVDTYAVSCELFGSTGTQPAGIGTACHEFSHCMCIPDMYDTNSEQFGMFAWDVMDFGSYGGDYYGDCPAPFTAYERMYCGWLTPTELDSPCAVSNMKALHDEPEAYIIYNDNKRSEFYMLENRQRKGFSMADPAQGLLITHVDFDPAAWTDNTVNSTSLQRMTVIPADNILSEKTIGGDTWPGTSKNTALTDYSKPAAELHNANVDGRKFMGKPIEEIEENNGLISFVFNGGIALPIPTAPQKANVTADGFTATWDRIVEASEYEIELTSSDINEQKHDISDLAIMQEDFHGFNNGTEVNGFTDVSNQLDSYTTLPGWEGSQIYTTPRNEIRIGAQKTGGRILSPWLGTKTKTITVSFTIRSYSTDTEPVYLIMGEGMEGGAVGLAHPTKEPVQYVITATTEEDEWWFGLSCDARCYVSEMSAYEGHITDEQLDAGYISTQITETQYFKTPDNSYTFTNLSPEKKYSYKVRALSGSAHSKWSEPVEVTLDASTGIINLTDMLTDQPTQLFDINGRKVKSASANGIYIIGGKKVVRK